MMRIGRCNMKMHILPGTVLAMAVFMLTHHVLPIYKYDCESLSCQDQGRDVDRCI